MYPVTQFQIQMARLYKTTDELIKGYNLPKQQSRGRQKGKANAQAVALRARPLKSGNVQLYLYSCVAGKVSRRAIGTIEPEHDQAAKARNVEAVRLAIARAGMENADAMRRESGFAPKPKKAALFVDYSLMLARRANPSRRYRITELINNVSRFTNGRNPRITDIDGEFVQSFIKYLSTATTNPKYKVTKPLADGTKHAIFRDLVFVINCARRDGLTDFNAATAADKWEKPKANPKGREFLTADELRRMADAAAQAGDVGRAFLFCCFTGLRYSDAKRLTWGDFSNDGGGLFVSLKMQKTGRRVTASVPKSAAALIGWPQRACDGEKVFYLPCNNSTNTALKRMAAAAGIKKAVTFHVSRHTCATLLLNTGVPIEVVAKQLGHADISTTQIYAKILNKTLSEQVAKLDEMAILPPL